MTDRAVVKIPTELLEQVERGNVLLFVGERLSRDSAGELVLDRLTAELAERAGLDADLLSFPEVAQAYEDARGRQALVEFVSSRVAALGDEPQSTHRLIAGLTQCSVLVTTTLSGRVERAFREAGRRLQVVVRNDDIPFEDEQVAQLFKLRGALDRRETLVLTEDDNEQFFEAQDSLSVVLQGYLARKTILFVGYDLADEHFKRLYSKIAAALDPFPRRSYAFGETPPPNVARWCKRKGVDVVAVDTTDFLQALVDDLAARARPPATSPHPTVARAAPLPEQPYKLLDYYEAGDAAIYFGRERETIELAALIHAHRLTLLYGASGVGKTSLLLAGAAPRLAAQDQPYATIYARALEDPALAIRRAVSRQLPDAALPLDGALVDFLTVGARALGRPIVLILDQFEEFFIRLSPQFRAAFTAELGAICDARDLPIKVVLSLREDWLAAVNELERRIPEIFRNRLRVLPLTRAQASQAITTPVAQLGVQYEPTLVEHLLDDLAGSASTEIMPPQLQLVCSALYRRLPPGERTITLASYAQIGGARGILQQYLDDELARLSRDERALARATLAELVTSQGTKAVRSADELALALDSTPETLAPVLERLLGARLLRALEREDGAPSYELAHEYLIREIALEADAKTRKQAEELIRQEVDNWQRFGTLLAADKLALINDVRAVLRLSPESQELLLRSALEVGDEIEYWLGRIDDPVQRAQVLADKARTRVPVVRLRTARVLGTQDVPASVAPLLELALNDPDLTVRAAARGSLAKLAGQRVAIVAALRTTAERSRRAERKASLETLTRLPLRDLPFRLRFLVRGTQARLGAAWFVSTPIRRNATLLVGGILVVAFLLYATALNSYYLDASQAFLPDTAINQDTSNDVVIRQGVPWLTLPGLNQTVIHTGLPLSRIPILYRQKLKQTGIWGFWRLYGNRPYEKWGKDLAIASYLEDGIPMLWYLNPTEGEKAVFGATGSSDALSRRWAAYAIEQIAEVQPSIEPKAIEALTLLGDDSDARVRISAAAALSRLPHAPAATLDRASQIVSSMLHDEDNYISSSAWSALGQVSLARPENIPTVIPMLIDAVSRSNGYAMASLDVIARSSPANAEQVLVAFNQLPSQSGSPRSASILRISTLVDIGIAIPTIQIQVVPTLETYVSTGEYYYNDSIYNAVARVAQFTPENRAHIISHLGGQIVEGGGFTPRATQILVDMVRINPATAPQIVALLNERYQTIDNNFPNYSEPGIVISAFRQIGQVVRSNPATAPQIVPTLITALDRNNSPTKIASAIALTQIPDVPSQIITTTVVPLLVSALQDKDRTTQIESAIALVQTPGVSATIVDTIMNMMKNLLNDRDEIVRSDAVAGLASIADEKPVIAARLVEPLLVLLNDRNTSISGNAAHALVSIAMADPSAVPQHIFPTLYNILNSYELAIQYDSYAASFNERNLIWQATTLTQSDQTLIAMLGNPLDSSKRPLAALTLFERALHRSSSLQPLRLELQPFAEGTEPIARLWANITLHLFDIADMAHQANDDPAKRDLLVRELLRRSAPSAAQGPSRPFFFADDIAAQEALVWLSQQSPRRSGAAP